ncbi:MAG TPA: glucose-6-phosphate dehydrogenase [Acholeplasma sp.]|nr:glucose-6-phosphate dehydrogenase [Acholeplasma sp.]
MKKDLIITIFGSTGDLTARKLLPAITKLMNDKLQLASTLVIAVGRKDHDVDSYIESVKKIYSDNKGLDALKDVILYHHLDINTNKDYQTLSELIKKHANKNTRKLYYLAVGPDLLEPISQNFSQSGLVKKDDFNSSIVFEKPFGNDLESAKKINELLWQYFDEKQIYRIDHYLGKEMIQNILTVRFANKIFEDSWHNNSIKSIKLIVKETDGILSRGGYYDSSGALKDMIQSHLLQMLALVSMEVPNSYQSDDLKEEKIKVLQKLKYDKDSLIMGQYKGYLNEENVKNDSRTETFVFVKAFVDTPRFKGVPMYLLTGKKLDIKESVIIVEFEETSQQRKWHLPLKTNKLYIKIAPEDGISLALNSKVPGLSDDVESVELEYCIACNAVGNMPEAYEKLILDLTNYHKRLFTRWDEIEYSWQFVDQIKQDFDDSEKELFIYNDFNDIKKMIKKLTNEVF